MLDVVQLLAELCGRRRLRPLARLPPRRRRSGCRSGSRQPRRVRDDVPGAGAPGGMRVARSARWGGPAISTSAAQRARPGGTSPCRGRRSAPVQLAELGDVAGTATARPHRRRSACRPRRVTPARSAPVSTTSRVRYGCPGRTAIDPPSGIGRPSASWPAADDPQPSPIAQARCHAANKRALLEHLGSTAKFRIEVGSASRRAELTSSEGQRGET